jgi:AraC-like DNA-binding protein
MNGFRRHEGLQRVGLLAFVPMMLRRMGVDAEEIITQSGLPADALNDPEGVVAFSNAARMLMLAAKRTHCPSFGLELGKNMRLENLGIVGEYIRHAPSLRTALQDFAAHQHRNSHGSLVYLLEEEANAFFGYAIYEPVVDGYSIICDTAAMAAFQLVCQLAVETHVPKMEIHLCRDAPKDLEPYRMAFGDRFVFNTEQTCVAFLPTALDQPVPGADSARRKALGIKLQATWHAGEFDLDTQLRREIRMALLGGRVSATQIATRLGLGRRNLDRRLEQAGLRYQQVLDETRSDFAQQLLAYTRLDIFSIATILGFTSPDSLTHAFARWNGVTPSAWRVGASNAPQ